VRQDRGQTPTELIRRRISIAPRIEIRPGDRYNVMGDPGLVFPRTTTRCAR